MLHKFLLVHAQVSKTDSKQEEKDLRRTKMNGDAPYVDRIPQETLKMVQIADSWHKWT